MKDEEWQGEYMWMLDFDEAGEKLVRVFEFVDSLKTEELLVMVKTALGNLAKMEKKE